MRLWLLSSLHKNRRFTQKATDKIDEKKNKDTAVVGKKEKELKQQKVKIIMARRKTHKIDASGKILGRLAVEIAKLLRGKDKVDFTLNTDKE